MGTERNANCPQKKVTRVFTCQTVSEEDKINRKRGKRESVRPAVAAGGNIPASGFTFKLTMQ